MVDDYPCHHFFRLSRPDNGGIHLPTFVFCPSHRQPSFIYSHLAAIKLVEYDLQATTNEIALTLSLFILVQGTAPLVWSSISEIKGRKFVYILSMVVSVQGSLPVCCLSPWLPQIFTVGSAIGGASKYISVLIFMRIFQAAGSSAVLAIGAGTLAVSMFPLSTPAAFSLPISPQPNRISMPHTKGGR